MQWYWQQYLDDKLPSPEYLVAPARAESHAGLPPAVVVTAGSRCAAERGRVVCAAVACRECACRASRLPGAVPRLPDDHAVLCRCRGPGIAVGRHAAAARRGRGGVGVTVDAIVIGAGFAGLYAVHRLSVGGPDGAGHRGRAERRRHLVLEPLSRCALRRRKRRLLILFRRRAAERLDVDGAVRGAARDPGVPRPCGRPVRSAASLPCSTPRWSVRGSTTRSNGWCRRRRARATAARFLLCATGCLSAVNRPDIPGLDDFAGEVYYTAAWPREDPDLRGKKIGVIGTGSSGIQVAPILAEQAESLVVFQRSPNYTMPMPNHPWSDEDLERIRREYPERRQRSAYAPAGTPHGTYHTERARHGSRGTGRGDVAALARRRRAVQQDVPRPDVGAGGQRHRAAVRRGPHPRDRRRPRGRRGSDPHRPPDRDEAHLHRRGLLRDVQPRQRAAGEPAPRADRGDHRQTACARAKRPTSAMCWCSRRVSTR